MNVPMFGEVYRYGSSDKFIVMVIGFDGKYDDAPLCIVVVGDHYQIGDTGHWEVSHPDFKWERVDDE